VTGARADRRELNRMLARLGPGDVVMVARIDRLARSTFDLFAIVKQIVDAKAQFRSLAEPWADTSTSTGRLMIAVLGGLADVERDLIRTRTAAAGGRRHAQGTGEKLQCRRGDDLKAYRGAIWGTPLIVVPCLRGGAMTAFILTWKEEVWSYEALRQTIDAYQRNGIADENWRVFAHRVAKPGDLAFLFKQGVDPRGIFGFGYLLDAPSLREDPTDSGPPRMRAKIRFVRLSDPKTQPLLISLGELLDVLPTWQINAQASGQAPLSVEAETWLRQRLRVPENLIGISIPADVNSIGPTRGGDMNSTVHSQLAANGPTEGEAVAAVTHPLTYERRLLRAMRNGIRDALARESKKAHPARVDITVEQMTEMLREQGNRCALTGLPFWSDENQRPYGPMAPSIDRIDPDGDYTLDNVRVVLYGVNAMRGRGTNGDMYRIAQALIDAMPGLGGAPRSQGCAGG
jgi:hypothetical protein